MSRVVTEQMLLFSGASTFGDASTVRHGLLPKLSGSATDVLKGDGTFGPLSGGTAPGPSLPSKLYDYTVTGADKAAIDTFVDGTTAASFPGYDVLEFWLVGRTDDGTALPNIQLRFNNDSGNNYDKQYTAGVDTSASIASFLAQTSFQTSFHGSGGGANFPAIWHCSIPNYLGTTFYKTFDMFLGADDSTAGNNVVGANIGTWRSTAAVTRIALSALGAQKFKVGTRLIVYGR